LIGHRFNNFSPPGDYIFVIADGINNLNQVVGTADDNGFLTITASSRESVFLGRRGPCHWASMIAASLWACTWRTGVLDAVSRSRTESTFHSAIQGRREPLPVASTAWGKSWDPIPSMG
jgi:hypothetical protein